MKKLVLFSLLLSLASCGKNEIVGSLKKEVSDGFNVIQKSIKDSIKTTAKGISDSNETVKTTLTDSREILEHGSNSIVKSGGELAEGVGQIPRSIGNKLLGTSEDSDEKLDDTNDNLDNTNENLENLEEYVNLIYQEFLQAFADLSQDMDDMKIELQGENQALQDTIDSIHTSLLRKINRGDRKNLRKIQELKNKVNRLRRNVRTIRRNLNNLEVVCEYDDFLWSVDFATYCELESNNSNH